jgi:hypothetical protein
MTSKLTFDEFTSTNPVRKFLPKAPSANEKFEQLEMKVKEAIDAEIQVAELISHIQLRFVDIYRLAIQDASLRRRLGVPSGLAAQKMKQAVFNSLHRRAFGNKGMPSLAGIVDFDGFLRMLKMFPQLSEQKSISTRMLAQHRK